MVKQVIITISLLLIVLSSCSTNKSSKVSETTTDMEEESILQLPENYVKPPYGEANNSFAFKLFGQINDNSKSDENIIISPLSVAYALSMTLNGAKGSTDQAKLQTLELSGYTKDELNQAVKNLSSVIFDKDSGVEISLANSVWSRSDITINKEFTSVLEQYYKAESRQFKPGDKNAVTLVNKWIEDKTDGMIKNMLDKVDDNIIMMLVNAICFKGKWTNPFSENATIDAPFYPSVDKKVNVKMMNLTKSFNYFDGEGYKMVELPYGDERFAIDIFLPDNDRDIEGFLEEINIGEVTNAIQNMTRQSVKLSLPRFKYEYKKELKDILSDMGMAIAFGGGANFSGISQNAKLAIDNVTHKACIETTEEGTKAAAATVVGIKLMSARPVEPINFIIDRPFFYIIRDTESNVAIFMGKIVNPE